MKPFTSMLSSTPADDAILMESLKSEFERSCDARVGKDVVVGVLGVTEGEENFKQELIRGKIILFRLSQGTDRLKP